MQPVEVTTCREALSVISEFGVTAVFCDEMLPWRDLLSYLAEDCQPPRVVVVAAAPCESLWADVINLGGFDVLAKPFVEREVNWVLSTARSSTASQPPARRPPARERTEIRAYARAHSA
jgi:DNA-binding response OmpR family regulator